ncbi:MAG: hypothetical protein ACUVRQ_06880, partial [Thermoanaerobaculaceae bacterium]
MGPSAYSTALMLTWATRNSPSGAFDQHLSPTGKSALFSLGKVQEQLAKADMATGNLRYSVSVAMGLRLTHLRRLVEA